MPQTVTQVPWTNIRLRGASTTNRNGIAYALSRGSILPSSSSTVGRLLAAPVDIGSGGRPATNIILGQHVGPRGGTGETTSINTTLTAIPYGTTKMPTNNTPYTQSSWIFGDNYLNHLESRVHVKETVDNKNLKFSDWGGSFYPWVQQTTARSQGYRTIVLGAGRFFIKGVYIGGGGGGGGGDNGPSGNRTGGVGGTGALMEAIFTVASTSDLNCIRVYVGGGGAGGKYGGIIESPVGRTKGGYSKTGYRGGRGGQTQKTGTSGWGGGGGGATVVEWFPKGTSGVSYVILVCPGGGGGGGAGGYGSYPSGNFLTPSTEYGQDNIAYLQRYASTWGIGSANPITKKYTYPANVALQNPQLFFPDPDSYGEGATQGKDGNTNFWCPSLSWAWADVNNPVNLLNAVTHEDFVGTRIPFYTGVRDGYDGPGGWSNWTSFYSYLANTNGVRFMTTFYALNGNVPVTIKPASTTGLVVFMDIEGLANPNTYPAWHEQKDGGGCGGGGGPNGLPGCPGPLELIYDPSIPSLYWRFVPYENNGDRDGGGGGQGFAWYYQYSSDARVNQGKPGILESDHEYVMLYNEFFAGEGQYINKDSVPANFGIYNNFKDVLGDRNGSNQIIGSGGFGGTGTTSPGHTGTSGVDGAFSLVITNGTWGRTWVGTQLINSTADIWKSNHFNMQPFSSTQTGSLGFTGAQWS